MRGMSALYNFVGAIGKTVSVALLYGGIGLAILLAISATTGAAELPKLPPGYKWESCKWTGEKWTDCRMVPKAPSQEADTVGTNYRGGGLHISPPPGVSVGQIVPWASTYLWWDGARYTHAWNLRTQSWGPYYPMGAMVSVAPAPTIVVVPGYRHGYRDDPIRSFKRMMREFERFGHRDRYRDHWRHQPRFDPKHDHCHRYHRSHWC